MSYSIVTARRPISAATSSSRAELVRLDGAREAGQAFIIAELGNVRRQN